MTRVRPNRLLVIQPGEKLATLAAVPGDFADWVRDGLGVEAADALVVYPHRGDPLPDPTDFRATVITGSSAMVTDAAPWIVDGSAWLARAVRCRVPLLGICFGHQWLGQALGGRVAENPLGPEVGTVNVRLCEAARTDPLLAGLPASMPLHVSHRQSVVTLPPHTIHLAASDLEPHQAFRAGDCAWGVQFHPEFNGSVLQGYLDYHSPSVIARGGDPQALREAVADSGFGHTLLRRFAEFAGLGRGGSPAQRPPPAATSD
jgi:GMP synthase (glutamine-hydrolysing)